MEVPTTHNIVTGILDTAREVIGSGTATPYVDFEDGTLYVKAQLWLSPETVSVYESGKEVISKSISVATDIEKRAAKNGVKVRAKPEREAWVSILRGKRIYVYTVINLSSDYTPEQLWTAYNTGRWRQLKMGG